MSVKIFRWLVIASIVAALAWIKFVRDNDLAFGRDAEYLTNVQMRNLLNRFDAFCIDFDQATSSCTSVSRPTRVDERLAQFEIFTLLPSPEAGTYLKKNYRRRQTGRKVVYAIVQFPILLTECWYTHPVIQLDWSRNRMF